MSKSSTHQKRFLFIFGTRPEVVKMAPVILEAQKQEDVSVEILHTGQHQELAEEMLELFKITPTHRLNVMRENQSLFGLTSRIMTGLSEIIPNGNFDMIFVQGDTSSAFLGALAGFYSKVPVAHIEAGLRTDNRYNPFPEEINRRLVSPLASLNFTPTDGSKQNLLKENIPDKSIITTGNTVIDALLHCINIPHQASEELTRLFNKKKFALVTTHRRENFGAPHKEVFDALLELANTHQDLHILFPVHPNPNVRKEVSKHLNNHQRIHLTAPLGYLDFINAMKNCFMILSDSGGVQEEAPTLKKPVLVLRETTERPEGLHTGALKLVGTNKEQILKYANKLLNDPSFYDEMTSNPNPYGDGKAAARIIDSTLSFLK